MPTACRVVLKPRRARPFFARHPWVYGDSIARVEGSPGPGDEVDLYSHEGAFIARGLYNPASLLRVWLYRWHQVPLDSGFWLDKLECALRLRTTALGLRATGTAYRLVFSEGDGLSGLTVDRFDEWLVVQFSSLARHRRRELFLDHLLALTGARGAIARPERGIAAEEGPSRGDVHIVGTLPPQLVTIVENELEYLVDLESGQKTGFYCDQRENRRRMAAFCGVSECSTCSATPAGSASMP
jgi:23S rRNA (cytosine1962-C5)-methyltransferase